MSVARGRVAKGMIPGMGLLGAFLLGACGQDHGSGESAVPVEQSTALDVAIDFIDGTEAAGVSFRHIAGRSAHKPMPEVMGGGVAIADFNRDGAPDLLFVNSGALGSVERPPGADNRLYLNDGAGRFTDVTAQWQLPSRGYGMGVAIGDVDNDGYPDVVLTHFDGELILLRNSGGERFVDISAEAGLRSDGRWGTSAGFFDQDNDGWLDLYVVRYLELPLRDAPQSYRNGILTYPTPLLFAGVPDQFWRNQGDGRLIDASAELGIDRIAGKGLALAIGDLDLDGRAEVYVANDTDANQLWTYSGDGRWKDIAALAGSAFDEQGREEGSMGADYSDFDGDGLPDITVSNFQLEVTSIYRQREGMLFTEVSDLVGVGQSSRQRLSFGIDFFDVNNDGNEDLLVANGHIEDNIHLNSDTVSFPQQNSLYLNQGDGRFIDVSDQAGPALRDVQVSRGLASGDLDGDGALDFVIVNNEGGAQIAFNRSPSLGRFVTLWLEGGAANRSAIGARAVAQIGERRIQRQVMGAQSYLSISDFRLHFGLGTADQIDALEIHWPGGEVQQIGPLAHGQHYYIRQGQAPQSYVPGASRIAP
jgi:enediyne biosynthesis protein E4